MKHQFDKEACPACGSESYDCVDYEADFNGEEAWQHWRCHCDKCGCIFDMDRVYVIADVSVTNRDGE